MCIGDGFCCDTDNVIANGAILNNFNCVIYSRLVFPDYISNLIKHKGFIYH